MRWHLYRNLHGNVYKHLHKLLHRVLYGLLHKNLCGFGTANKRFTGICWAHKARVLASAYYHNRRYIEIGDCLPIKAELPELDALTILPSWEYDEFLEIEKKALAKFADAVGIS